MIGKKEYDTVVARSDYGRLAEYEGTTWVGVLYEQTS